MTLKKFLEITYIPKDLFYEMNSDLKNLISRSYGVNNDLLYNYRYPLIICNDGVSISIQAGNFLYSYPSIKSEYYETVEISTIKSDKIMKTGDADIGEDNEISIRGFTPVEEVQDFLDRHDGIDEIKTFENCYEPSQSMDFYFHPNHKYLRKKKLTQILK